MKFDLLKKINSNLPSESGVKFVLAVSGGADSVFLLTLLHELNLPLIIAHFNHKLRFSAERDIKFVADLALAMGIPFIAGEGDVQKYSLQNGLSIEEAARIMRYRFLVKVAKKNNSKYVITAHNANDQVETMLMHFLRGSGLAGLTGMRVQTRLAEFDDQVIILRPMLAIWRSEVEGFLEDQEIAFCVDETNLDQKYARNKMRYEVLPYLNSHFNQLSERLLNTSEILKTDLEIIDQYVQDRWQELAYSSDNVVHFTISNFLNESIGMQRHLLRKAILQLQSNVRDISFQAIERGRLAVASRRYGQIDLVNNLMMYFTHDSFFIAPKNTSWLALFFPQLDENARFTYDNNGNYQIGTHWRLIVKSHPLANLNDEIENNDPCIANLDLEKVGGFPLIVRGFEPGERFQPLGLVNGQMKISDFFTNQKIPRFARPNWPIVYNSNGQIVWVSGLRLGHAYRITSTSRQFIQLEIEDGTNNKTFTPR